MNKSIHKFYKALSYFYQQEDIQGGRDEYWRNFRVLEKAVLTLDVIAKKLMPMGREYFLPMDQDDLNLIKELFEE